MGKNDFLLIKRNQLSMYSTLEYASSLVTLFIFFSTCNWGLILLLI